MRRWALVRVRGRSMLPTLPDGCVLVVDRRRAVRPADLVVVGLPGGRPDAVKRALRRDAAGWWVERDNPREGVDSWLVGAIPAEQVRGVVVARVWPRPTRSL